jgi:uncharacterized protein (TIGR03086 family)
MSTLDDCKRTLKNAQEVVDQVQSADLGKRTPCTDWNVRTLINHMVEVLDAVEAPARGEALNFSTQDVQDVIGQDPAGAFSKKASEFVAAWSAPGAPDRLVTTMFGEQPAQFYLGLAAADMLMHGWDLANAIGVPYTMDEAVATEVLTNMQQMLKPEMRGQGKAFAAEVAVDPSASVQERLVAFSGRKPLLS